jgi:CRP-like cAMP-binding protein
MPVVRGQFSVDIEKLHNLGMVDPHSKESLDIFQSGQLTAEERLYFTLWSCRILSAVNLSEGQRLLAEGDDVATGYFLIDGGVMYVSGETAYRLGPGAVIGVAEGMARKPMRFDVVVTKNSRAMSIPLYQADAAFANLPPTMRGIFSTVTGRTLGLPKDG